MSRRTNTLPLGVHLTPPPRAKGRWIVEALRIAIRDGRLPLGSQMPSSRDLAQQWGVSRGLVSAAYEELQIEGLLTSAAGSGTYVRKSPGAGASGANPTPTGDAQREPHIVEPPSWFRLNPEKPFIARETDVSLFPINIWKKLALQVLSNTDNLFFYDPDPDGYPGLRQQVARYLGFSRSITCTADDIIITNGTRHSLDLCLRALTAPGDRAWIESPGHAGSEFLVRSHRVIPVPVAIDSQGLRVTAAQEIAPDAKLCIVTPSHQSPLGVRLSYERRQQLLLWAERMNSYVFEDDYDGEFAFDSVRFPAFKAMDTCDRVIHAGSFNKVLFPTLRIGYIVVPKALKLHVRRLRGETSRNNSATDQRILSHFIAEGHFAHHIRRMARSYHEKCRAAIRAIEGGYGGTLEIQGAHGGFHFFLLMPAATNMLVFREECKRHNFAIQTASVQTDNGSRDGIVIGYSALSLGTIEKTGLALGTILRLSRNP